MTKAIKQLLKHLLNFEPTLTKSLSELKVVQENKPKVENNIPKASQKTKKMAKTNMNLYRLQFKEEKMISLYLRSMQK